MTDMNDEFAEFETSEDEFDAMLAAGTPVEIVNSPISNRVSGASLYEVVAAAPATMGGSRVDLRTMATLVVGSVSANGQDTRQLTLLGEHR